MALRETAEGHGDAAQQLPPADVAAVAHADPCTLAQPETDRETEPERERAIVDIALHCLVGAHIVVPEVDAQGNALSKHARKRLRRELIWAAQADLRRSAPSLCLSLSPSLSLGPSFVHVDIRERRERERPWCGAGPSAGRSARSRC
jgi:hypothetical protein